VFEMKLDIITEELPRRDATYNIIWECHS